MPLLSYFLKKVHPLPCAFSSWDANKDGLVDRREFTYIMGVVAGGNDVKDIFRIADLNSIILNMQLIENITW